MNDHFYYCEYSKTIRQMPQNYLLARNDEMERCMKMDPDLSADPKLVVALTLALLDYENKYVNHPQQVIACAVENLQFLKQISINGVL
jgi:hypothetical protein